MNRLASDFSDEQTPYDVKRRNGNYLSLEPSETLFWPERNIK